MNYICTCEPTQSIPHLIRSPKCTYRALTIPSLRKNKRIILIRLITNLSPAKSCCDQPVPLKKYQLKIAGINISFGSLVR